MKKTAILIFLLAALAGCDHIIPGENTIFLVSPSENGSAMIDYATDNFGGHKWQVINNGFSIIEITEYKDLTKKSNFRTPIVSPP